ncbi:hypothetical protein CJJ09_005649 [Candidozyma auris]|nr:hypothetical protein CJJ09_005649 [[Candida] auris]
MPWDEDLDVQITMSSLHVLARHYNQSVVVDVTDGIQTGHMYLIDVNPHFLQRDRGKGDNVIDARFIDVSTGLYVDITALAVSNDLEVVQNSPGTKRHNRLHQVFDPSYTEISKSFEHAPRLRDSIEARLQRLERGQWKAGKLYNCKDDHFYLLDELGLIPTKFEGVQAYVPIAYRKILKREYPRGTKARIYEGWRFSDKLQLWLPISECGKAGLGCDKEDWILEENSLETFAIRQRSRASSQNSRQDRSLAPRAQPKALEAHDLDHSRSSIDFSPTSASLPPLRSVPQRLMGHNSTTLPTTSPRLTGPNVLESIE